MCLAVLMENNDGWEGAQRPKTVSEGRAAFPTVIPPMSRDLEQVRQERRLKGPSTVGEVTLEEVPA